eukprot:ANDGO_08302.mRNA.1 hypothetical protein H257_09680
MSAELAVYSVLEARNHTQTGPWALCKVVLAAMKDSIASRGLTESATAYFAALMDAVESGLDRLDLHALEATLKLIEINMQDLSENVIRSSYANTIKLMGTLMDRYSETAGIVKILLRILSFLPLSAHHMQSLLFPVLLDTRGKVRKEAQDTLATIAQFKLDGNGAIAVGDAFGAFASAILSGEAKPMAARQTGKRAHVEDEEHSEKPQHGVSKHSVADSEQLGVLYILHFLESKPIAALIRSPSILRSIVGVPIRFSTSPTCVLHAFRALLSLIESGALDVAVLDGSSPLARQQLVETLCSFVPVELTSSANAFSSKVVGKVYVIPCLMAQLRQNHPIVPLLSSLLMATASWNFDDAAQWTWRVLASIFTRGNTISGGDAKASSFANEFHAMTPSLLSALESCVSRLALNPVLISEFEKFWMTGFSALKLRSLAPSALSRLFKSIAKHNRPSREMLLWLDSLCRAKATQQKGLDEDDLFDWQEEDHLKGGAVKVLEQIVETHGMHVVLSELPLHTKPISALVPAKPSKQTKGTAEESLVISQERDYLLPIIVRACDPSTSSLAFYLANLYPLRRILLHRMRVAAAQSLQVRAKNLGIYAFQILSVFPRVASSALQTTSSVSDEALRLMITMMSNMKDDSEFLADVPTNWEDGVDVLLNRSEQTTVFSAWKQFVSVPVHFETLLQHSRSALPVIMDLAAHGDSSAMTAFQKTIGALVSSKFISHSTDNSVLAGGSSIVTELLFRVLQRIVQLTSDVHGASSSAGSERMQRTTSTATDVAALLQLLSVMVLPDDSCLLVLRVLEPFFVIPTYTSQPSIVKRALRLVRKVVSAFSPLGGNPAAGNLDAKRQEVWSAVQSGALRVLEKSADIARAPSVRSARLDLHAVLFSTESFSAAQFAEQMDAIVVDAVLATRDSNTKTRRSACRVLDAVLANRPFSFLIKALVGILAARTATAVTAALKLVARIVAASSASVQPIYRVVALADPREHFQNPLGEAQASALLSILFSFLEAPSIDLEIVKGAIHVLLSMFTVVSKHSDEVFEFASYAFDETSNGLLDEDDDPDLDFEDVGEEVDDDASDGEEEGAEDMEADSNVGSASHASSFASSFALDRGISRELARTPIPKLEFSSLIAPRMHNVKGSAVRAVDEGTPLERLVPALLRWSSRKESTSTVRLLAKRLWARLMRAYSFDVISRMVGTDHHALLVNIRKADERKRRNKDKGQANSNGAYDSDEVNTGKLAKKNEHKQRVAGSANQKSVSKDDGMVRFRNVEGDLSEAIALSKPRKRGFNDISHDALGYTNDSDEEEHDQRHEPHQAAKNLPSRLKRSVVQTERMGDREAHGDEEEGEGGDGDGRSSRHIPDHLLRAKEARKQSRQKMLFGDVHTGEEFSAAKRSRGDIKKPGKVDPYAYVPLNQRFLNKRYRHRSEERFTRVVTNSNHNQK